jgi:pimeloyl-ACP methyl ester carboxylesterase
MGSIEVIGATLAAQECGSGPLRVLVHGSASDHRTWAAQREAWCDTARVVTYSRRYHWPNDPIEADGTYALGDHVDDMGVVLRSVADEPATLIGHSYGGVVALLAAARWPERVAALVLVEPPVLGVFVHVPPRPLELLRLALRRPRTAIGILKLGAGALGPAQSALERGDEEEAMRRMGRGILGPEAHEAMDDERRAQVRDNIILEELSSREALPRLDPGEIRSIRCPALLVGGSRSPTVFARLLDALEELLPRTDRVTIPGASHLVHEDEPGAFHAAVESFLSGRRAD